MRRFPVDGEGENPAVYEKCVLQAFAILEAHFAETNVDPFADAPVEIAHGTIYMVYDDDIGCWRAIDLNEELLRIARESSERRKNLNDGN